MKRHLLELRSRVLAATRDFFQKRDYTQVETPVWVATPAMEEHIDAVSAGEGWLRTSPELHMKRLICEGMERIYQMGPCFRRGERGARHLPEYTMLEWYHVGIGSEALLEETLDLLTALAPLGEGTALADLGAEPLIMTVQDAFWLWAGWDPVDAFDADRFDLDLVEKVEPVLAEQPGPVVLKDFPLERSALAACRPGPPPVADRWELYLGGMELANAYHELTDPHEQRQRFLACRNQRQQRGQDVYPLDEPFLTALENGMPSCSGIALGMDRLLMVLSGCEQIQDVVAFSKG